MRTRTSHGDYAHYTYDGFGTTWDRGFSSGSATVVDAGPGWHQDQYFHVDRWSAFGGKITGAHEDHRFEEFPAYRYQHEGPGFPDYFPDVPSDGALAYKVLEKTNPSVPVVDIPALIGELTEIPKALLAKGRSLTRTAAGVNLEYQFNIAPLVSDVLKIVLLLDDIERRVKFLNKLNTNGQVRKVATVCKMDRKLSYPVSINSDLQVYIDGTEELTQTVKIWGYTTWYLSNPISLQGKNLGSIAVNLVTGANFNLSTVWELLPWTWMIDWFANIGSILNATRNSLDCHPGLVFLCEHRTHQIKTVDIHSSPSWVKMSPYQKVRETKERRLASPSFSASLPFINAKQASILGSLAIIRGR